MGGAWGLQGVGATFSWGDSSEPLCITQEPLGARAPAVGGAWGLQSGQWGGAQSFSRPCREGSAELAALGQREPHQDESALFPESR